MKIQLNKEYKIMHLGGGVKYNLNLATLSEMYVNKMLILKSPMKVGEIQ